MTDKERKILEDAGLLLKPHPEVYREGYREGYLDGQMDAYDKIVFCEECRYYQTAECYIHIERI